MYRCLDEDSKKFDPSYVDPVSSCEMELDCFARDMLNSLDFQVSLTDILFA
jgi:hypothetical protein